MVLFSHTLVFVRRYVLNTLQRRPVQAIKLLLINTSVKKTKQLLHLDKTCQSQSSITYSYTCFSFRYVMDCVCIQTLKQKLERIPFVSCISYKNCSGADNFLYSDNIGYLNTCCASYVTETAPLQFSIIANYRCFPIQDSKGRLNFEIHWFSHTLCLSRSINFKIPYLYSVLSARRYADNIEMNLKDIRLEDSE